jgi:hypothetical protein
MVHGLMSCAGQADQIPEAIRKLRVILSGPDVVHGVGLHGPAVPCRFLAAMPVTFQSLLPQALPPAVAAAVIKTCHEYLLGKTKSQHHETRYALHGAGSKALALSGNIHDTLGVAPLAVNRQTFRFGFRKQSQDLKLPASRTHKPPLICPNFITSV